MTSANTQTETQEPDIERLKQLVDVIAAPITALLREYFGRTQGNKDFAASVFRDAFSPLFGDRGTLSTIAAHHDSYHRHTEVTKAAVNILSIQCFAHLMDEEARTLQTTAARYLVGEWIGCNENAPDLPTL